MAKKLTELYRLREVAINVPDGNVAALKGVINAAVLDGDLPGDALTWVKAPGASSEKPEAAGKGKGKKAKEKEPEAPPEPPKPLPPAKVSKTQGGWAAWKAQHPGEEPPIDPNTSADGSIGKAPPPGTGVDVIDVGKAKPAKKKFDASKEDPEYGSDMPSWAAPQSANVKLNKHGQPLKAADDENPNPDMFAHKKVGRLARVFGQKTPDTGMVAQPKKGLKNLFKAKGPQFRDDENPYAFNPQSDWQVTGDPFAPEPGPKQFKKPAPIPDDETGDDAMTSLKATLAQNHVKKKQEPLGGGDAAMKDLEWDLKRSKGKR